jgi:hypothetical protein
MTKRLQVLFEDEELAEIQALARQRRQTTAAWVRDALRAARLSSEYPPPEAKLRAVREAAAYAFPVGSIEEMRAEIERGYLAGPTELERTGPDTKKPEKPARS